MASAEFHKWHRQNIDPQGSFQVDNFAKCWADAIKSAEALKPSHDNEMCREKKQSTKGIKQMIIRREDFKDDAAGVWEMILESAINSKLISPVNAANYGDALDIDISPNKVYIEDLE